MSDQTLAIAQALEESKELMEFIFNYINEKIKAYEDAAVAHFKIGRPDQSYRAEMFARASELRLLKTAIEAHRKQPK